MLKNNCLPWKTRFKELVFDYLFILIYLTILFVLSMIFYYLIIKGIPQFNELQTQLISMFFSVIPIILIFSLLDYKKGTMGKRKSNLKLYYSNKNFMASLLRNIVKFLPWQLGHIGVIHGIYSNFDLLSIIISSSGIALGIILFLMGFLRKDKRHLGDLIAKTQVQVEK